MEWSGTPAYKRVAEEFRRRIVDGKLPPETPLGTNTEIMKKYDVSITVARMAMKELKAEGLVVVAPGKGNFVGNGRPEGTPEFEQTMQLLGKMQERIDHLTDRLEWVESRVGVRPESSAGPGHPAGQRGQP